MHTWSFLFLKLKRHVSITSLLMAVPNGGLFVHPKTVVLSVVFEERTKREVSL